MSGLISNITVLVSDPVDQDTPEIFRFVDTYIDGLREANVGAQVRVCRMNLDSLFNEAASTNPDLIVTIGHGSEDAELVFESTEAQFFKTGRSSELVKFESLDDNVKKWFAGAGCVMVFACHGSRWIENAAGVKWIAFDEQIPQMATTALVGRLVNPSGKSILSQIKDAMSGSLSPEYAKWVNSVRPSHPDPAGYPAYERGSLEIIKGSAESFGSSRLLLSAASVTEEFVGREDLLHLLTIPPSAQSMLERQRVTWIRGEAGIGKSTLLRKAGERLTSYWFESRETAPLLVGVDLSGTISFDEACRKIVSAVSICLGEQIEREDCRTEDLLDQCFAQIKKTRRAFVLIVDDTTYLDLGIDEETRDAGRLTGLLLGLARSHQVLFHCITSNRYPNTALDSGRDLELEPLSLGQAATLAYKLLLNGRRPEVISDSGETRSLREFLDEYGNPVGIIFDATGRNTKRFRYTIDLAQGRAWDLRETARQCIAHGADLQKMDRELMKSEWENAPKFGNTHGVNWSGFLLTLFPLARLAGSFTAQEYKQWLGDWVKGAGEDAICPEPVQRCLDLACAKDMLKRTQSSYRISPNYRIQAAALASMPGEAQRLDVIEELIKEHLPSPRSAGERLALCLEMAKAGHSDTIKEFLDLERDLEGLQGSSNETDEALAVSMSARAELAWRLLEDFDTATKIISDLEQRYGDHEFERVVERVAIALFNNTNHLWKLEKRDEYFKEVERIEEKFGEHPAPAVVEQVAKALFNSTNNLWKDEKRDEYFKEVERFEEKFGEHPAPAVVEQVAMALFNSTEKLWKIEKRDEYFKEVERFEERFGGHPAPAVVERVAMALFNSTEKLWKIEKRDEYFKEVERVLEKYSTRLKKDSPHILEKVLPTIKSRYEEHKADKGESP